MFASLMTVQAFRASFLVRSSFRPSTTTCCERALDAGRLQAGKQPTAVPVALAGAALIVPFFLFSGWRAKWPTNMTRRAVAEKLRFYEIAVALVAALGFLHAVRACAVRGLDRIRHVEALFGPIKYGILPVHLDIKEISAGNALIEGATFMAILLGTIVGGIAAAQAGEARLLAALVVTLSIVELAVGADDPGGAVRGSEPRGQSQSRGIDVVAGRRASSQPAAVDRRSHCRLVLARRRHGAGYPPDLYQGMAGRERIRLHRRAFAVHRQHRRGFAAGRSRQPHASQPCVGAHRGAADGAVRLRPRLDRERPRRHHGRKSASPESSARSQACGSLPTWPVSPSPAACSSCRRFLPCRPRRPKTAAPASSPPATCSRRDS